MASHPYSKCQNPYTGLQDPPKSTTFIPTTFPLAHATPVTLVSSAVPLSRTTSFRLKAFTLIFLLPGMFASSSLSGPCLNRSSEKGVLYDFTQVHSIPSPALSILYYPLLLYFFPKHLSLFSILLNVVTEFLLPFMRI